MPEGKVQSTIRAFIALELSPQVGARLSEYVAPLRRLESGVSWVKPDNVHLTLKFLGDVPERQIEEIAAALKAVCAKAAPIAVEIGECGVFPHPRHPRVLWVGIRERGSDLASLARQIDDSLHTLGFAKENREFSAHITLGRVRQGQARAILAAFKTTPFASCDMTFTECTFMKSQLDAAGSIYTPLCKFALGERILEPAQ